MKKQILMALSAFCCMAINAQSTNETIDNAESTTLDTLANINNAHNVLVTESPKGININVTGKGEDKNFKYSYHSEYPDNTLISSHQENSEWNFSIPFTNNKKNTVNLSTGGLSFGFCNALNAPANMDVQMGSSWEISWLNVLGLEIVPWKSSSAHFNIGFGIDWKNYCMKGTNRFIVDSDNNNTTTIGKYPLNETSIKSSRIKIFSLLIPLTYTQPIGKRFFVGGGAILNFNTYGSVKTEYTINDGTKCKDFNKHIHLNPVSIDFMATIGWKPFGVYVKYTPSNVLNTSFGPKFKSLSSGIILAF